MNFERVTATDGIRFRYARGRSMQNGAEIHPFHEILFFIKGDAEFISEKERMREAHRYLREYSVFRNLIENKTFDNRHFGNPRNYIAPRVAGEEGYELVAIARVRMFEIRRFITSLPSGDEKVFLFLHYVHGETIESCAEKLDKSYRQTFRLKKSALLLAHSRLLKWRIEGAKCSE